MRKILLFLLFIAFANCDTVLAKINGKEITDSDLKLLLSTTNPNLNYESLPKQQKIELLRKAVQKELFFQVAQKENIDKTKEFEQAMERLRKELILEIWLKKQTNYMIVSNSDAKKFYEQNKQSFLEPTRIKARQIVVATQSEANSVIAALKTLKGDMLKKTFIAIAKSNSIDTATKESGGDLGELAKDNMSADFSDAVWGLKAGTISPKPIQTGQGYHIVYVEARLAPAIIPFNKAKPRIVNLIKQQQFQLYINQLANQLAQKAQIEIKPQNIK